MCRGLFQNSDLGLEVGGNKIHHLERLVMCFGSCDLIKLRARVRNEQQQQKNQWFAKVNQMKE